VKSWPKFDTKKLHFRCVTSAAETLLAVIRGRHWKPTPITPSVVRVFKCTH